MYPNPNREKNTMLANGGHLQKKTTNVDAAMTYKRRKKKFLLLLTLTHAIISKDTAAQNVPMLFPDSPKRTAMAKTIAITPKRFLPNHALIFSILFPIFFPPKLLTNWDVYVIKYNFYLVNIWTHHPTLGKIVLI